MSKYVSRKTQRK
jgi:hypothetical protein